MITQNFGQLKVDDAIYHIDMAAQEIIKATVVDIHHSPLQGGTTRLKFFRTIRGKSGTLVTESYLKDIYDSEDQDKVFIDVIVQSKADMATLITKPPTVICTSEEKLKTWMRETVKFK